MLGKAADHFMLAQMRERVVAISPNAGGQSMPVFDRERPGTAHVMVKGGYQVPGPQRQVSSSYIPGMGSIAPVSLPETPNRGMLPGMGGGMLPGMGGGMLPGMGAITDLLTNKLVLVGLAVGGLFLVLRKKH